MSLGSLGSLACAVALSGCFLVVDFEDGAAGGGGDAGVAATSTGGASVGGGPAGGGAAGGGGGGCAGFCPELVTTVSGNILLLDAVQDTVAFMVAGEERVCIFNDTGTPLTCPTPGGCACVKSDDQAWNALGTHLALVNGAAFYSPQGISGGKPLFSCSDAGCVVAPPNAPTGSSGHLNGLAPARAPGNELLLAVDPISGSVAWTDGSTNFAISASR